MNNPLVSIIVPVYNVEAYIETCLHSLHGQTYSNLEVLFVDDKGQDLSITIVSDFIKKYNISNWRIFNHPNNRGLSAARNTGLMAAHGEYVYFLDSDDEITSECIEKLMENVLKHKFDIVIGGVIYVNEDTSFSEIKLIEGKVDDAMCSYANNEWYVMAWNKLCRKEFLIKNQLFFSEGLIHEDIVWSFKIASRNPKMFLSSAITYKYKLRKNSIMTGTEISNDVKNYQQVFFEIYEYIIKTQINITQYVYKILEGQKCRLLYSLLQNGEMGIYSMCFESFYKTKVMSPWKAWRRGIIGAGYLLRDFGYCMPPALGAVYKKLFYIFAYRLRGKQIEGAVWK